MFQFRTIKANGTVWITVDDIIKYMLEASDCETNHTIEFVENVIKEIETLKEVK